MSMSSLLSLDMYLILSIASLASLFLRLYRRDCQGIHIFSMIHLHFSRFHISQSSLYWLADFLTLESWESYFPPVWHCAHSSFPTSRYHLHVGEYIKVPVHWSLLWQWSWRCGANSLWFSVMYMDGATYLKLHISFHVKDGDLTLLTNLGLKSNIKKLSME